MKGSCLCGNVTFEFRNAIGPFELCHCNRCRKASGSAYAAFLAVKTDGYRVVKGREFIRSYEAPVVKKPPAYIVWFCSQCGSPVPDPSPEGDVFEIPAGTLDGATNVTPDKHIYVDLKADWDELTAPIARFTSDEIREFRAKHGRVAAQQGTPADATKRRS